MPGPRDPGIDRREAVQRHQHRRHAVAQAAVDHLVDAAMIGIEHLAAPRLGGLARRPSLPGMTVASLMRGIELGAVGGRLQSITSRE